MVTSMVGCTGNTINKNRKLKTHSESQVQINQANQTTHPTLLPLNISSNVHKHSHFLTVGEKVV
jgi:hypothetical protein